MTKIVEIKKRPPEHEEVADMLESFAAALRENTHGISDKLSSAVLVYKIDGHGIVFETTSNATPEQVGMMCSAVHIACIYESQPESESVH
jgi:hypothetical protein